MPTVAALSAFSDPRSFRDPSAAPEPARAWYALAGEALSAATGALAQDADRALQIELAHALDEAPDRLADAVSQAPSPAIARHLWRQVDAVWAGSGSGASGLVLIAFALPVVIVAALDGSAERVTVPGTLGDAAAVAELLRTGDALSGNRNFGLGEALVGAAALDIGALPRWRGLQRLPEGEAPIRPEPDALLRPLPIPVATRSEGVHVRFLVGTAVAAAGMDLFSRPTPGPWGAAFTRELARQLAVSGATILPLARAPGRPLPARHEGLVAQREVGAQLFAANAIRKLRASVGEPTAVISAHRAANASGGGELRVSISSPFEPRDAEGFRCPIYPIEAVGPVAAMLVGLLRDCRVTDIRLVGGVHPDRLPGGSMPLFFKPETIPEGALLH